MSAARGGGMRRCRNRPTVAGSKEEVAETAVLLARRWDRVLQKDDKKCRLTQELRSPIASLQQVMAPKRYADVSTESRSIATRVGTAEASGGT